MNDSQLSPTLWCLGRIVSVSPGINSVVRVARVLTSQNELIRAVVKLVLLPME